MSSIVKQTTQADEILLIEDGPLTPQLEREIGKWRILCGERLRVISLPLNVGRGSAFKDALEECRGEFVAIMDSDDICRADRFEVQLAFLKSHPDFDVVGGWIAEFDVSQDQGDMHLRKVKEHSCEIMEAARYRMPMNNVTTMYRKSSAIEAGGYLPFQEGMEDYHLYARMLARGSKFYNIQDVLVFVRVGAEMYRRRGGRKYFLAECKFQKFLHSIGIVNTWQVFLNIALRIPIRLSPNSVRKTIYQRLLRRKA